MGLHSFKVIDKRRRGETEEEEYHNTESASQYLLSSATCYLGALMELDWENFITPKALLNSMKTGTSQVYGGGDGMQPDKKREIT